VIYVGNDIEVYTSCDLSRKWYWIYTGCDLSRQLYWGFDV